MLRSRYEKSRIDVVHHRCDRDQCGYFGLPDRYPATSQYGSRPASNGDSSRRQSASANGYSVHTSTRGVYR